MIEGGGGLRGVDAGEWWGGQGNRESAPSKVPAPRASPSQLPTLPARSSPPLPPPQHPALTTTMRELRMENQCTLPPGMRR